MGVVLFKSGPRFRIRWRVRTRAALGSNLDPAKTWRVKIRSHHKCSFRSVGQPLIAPRSPLRAARQTSPEDASVLKWIMELQHRGRRRPESFSMCSALVPHSEEWFMCLSNLRVRVSAEVRKMVDDTFTSFAGGSGHPSLVNQALVDASKEQPLKGLRMVNVTVKMKPDSHDWHTCSHGKMQIRPVFYM